ncbi:hypothetical protein CALVIDRAFT_483902 [Calocera viscosa TUFC12733]|uniref:AttH domain-containing protein n=1 Tax=Calocera viscosa (strain TUFC12733) TaxID=1330018 RepID=A0A167KLR1_CALVF|nr:hypothetical protein CALVIDRAFT_483902 [Calocera viscosa TUFC12733]
MLALFAGISLLSRVAAQSVTTYPPYAVSGDSTVQFTLESNGFDAPKVNFYNSTSAQWWYFDVVSNDLSQSAVISFLDNAPGATGSPSGVLPFNFIEVNLQLSSGQQISLQVSGQWVILTSEGDGLSGVFNGSGYSWTGASDLSSYTVTLDDTANELSGTIQLNSDAPYHASCGTATPGASLLVSDQLGWANSIPDGTAIVDLTYNGLPIKYTGRGYHDSNWGSMPLEIMGTYYWGHARFGPYAVVWFDMLDTEGVEHQLGYVSENGKILANSCGSITVRPTGANSTYPPNANQSPTGFHILYDMGDAGIFELNATNTAVIQIEPPLYMRWVGSVVGGIQGKETYEGVSLYEWMIGYSGPLP